MEKNMKHAALLLTVMVLFSTAFAQNKYQIKRIEHGTTIVVGGNERRSGDIVSGDKRISWNGQILTVAVSEGAYKGESFRATKESVNGHSTMDEIAQYLMERRKTAKTQTKGNSNVDMKMRSVGDTVAILSDGDVIELPLQVEKGCTYHFSLNLTDHVIVPQEGRLILSPDLFKNDRNKENGQLEHIFVMKQDKDGEEIVLEMVIDLCFLPIE